MTTSGYLFQTSNDINCINYKIIQETYQFLLLQLKGSIEENKKDIILICMTKINDWYGPLSMEFKHIQDKYNKKNPKAKFDDTNYGDMSINDRITYVEELAAIQKK